MQFEHSLRYDAAPDVVFAMLREAVFREQVCVAQHVSECAVEIDGVDDSMTVTVEQRRPSEGIPSFARKFVGDTIHILQREDWSSAAGATLDVTIPGKPGHLRGSIALRRDGDGTVETVSGDLKVGIPLVGGKIEVLIAELLEHALQTEHRVGSAWLADRAG
ncbi:MAG TPA: DUF2505 domain-containing protein [Nocardioidaceae bacterium]